MEYVKLGNSDLNVSRICLGCMGFGDASIGQHSWTIGEEPTREIIRRSLDLGVNFFDTAIGYQLGTSEQYVGRALKDMARREDVVVATKFLPRTEEEIAKGINGRQHVMNSIDSSLQHLGMDYVDLYIYHIWDYKTPAEEILEGMNEAVRAGKTRYIGIANAYAYQVAKMNALAEKNGWAKFISVQNHYNLIMREEEREMYPFCREENIAMTPYSALASGKLAKRPGETSKRTGRRLVHALQIRCHCRAGQSHRGAYCGTGRPLWRGDDADITCLAADQGGVTHCRSHQAASYRGCRQVARCPSDCR